MTSFNKLFHPDLDFAITIYSCALFCIINLIFKILKAYTILYIIEGKSRVFILISQVFNIVGVPKLF